MSDRDKELQRDLECVRLASDFFQLSRDTLDPDLQAHCVRMAKYWSDQVDRDPKQDPTSLDNSG